MYFILLHSKSVFYEIEQMIHEQFQYLTARDEAEREAAASRTTRQSLLVDPFVLATGVQIIRAIGIKKAVTLLAVVGTGVALASRTWSPDRFEDLDQRQN